jgi:diguanylate cyclase (GGDEF)-like protein/PAS domain S-box-containing protein
MSGWHRVARALLGDPGGEHFMCTLPSLDAEMNEGLRELRRATGILRAALNCTQDHVCVLDGAGRVILVNQPWQARPLDPACPLHRVRLDVDYFQLCRQAQQDDCCGIGKLEQGLQQLLSGQAAWDTEYRFRAGSQDRWYRLSGHACSDGEARAILVQRDITTEKEQHQRLMLSMLLYENSSEAMMISDANNNIIAVNPAFTRLTGYAASEVQGRNPRLLSSGRQDGVFYRKMWEQLQQWGVWQGEIWNRRADGREYAEWLTIRVLRDSNGAIERYLAMFSDITEKKQSNELIWHQANFDALTGLPNRQLFLDRLALEVKKASRTGSGLALLMIDLDHFKDINDALGHSYGDQLLTAVSHRISASVRESDTVARLGGDEFTVILTDLSQRDVIDRVAQAILSTLSQPFDLNHETIFLSASIGISTCPSDASEGEALLQHADQAMYTAKSEGRGHFRYYRSHLQDEALSRLRLLADLRIAVDTQQLKLYFQPIVDLASGRVKKAEALLRWPHPVRGWVSPGEFIPAAEDTGLITEIGDWAFKEAASWAKRWSDRLGAPFKLSVNKSPVELNHLGRHSELLDYLAAQSVPPECMVLEITEGVMLEESHEVRARLAELKAAGIGLSIDDFGTGYSSMSYLNRLQADYLKIDQSFVRDMETNSAHRAMVEAIIVMAHKLGMEVVAEGVETAQQRAILQAAGCDLGQGFLFSPALAPEEFEARLGPAFAWRANDAS